MTRLGLCAVLLGTGLCGAETVDRSMAEELALLKQQVAQLRAEIDELKRPAPAPAPVSVVQPAQAPAESNGFKFSGDFRYRLDAQLRSSNDVASPLQNIRSRYRLRLNVDKALDRRFAFHLQLSTGPLNNGITNDQDMAGGGVKHPFSIAEAYVDFHPNSVVSLRGGRMEEVFADNTRFLWDDDVRFNGFQQVLKIPVGSNILGIKRVELRAGEYILSNPNAVVLTSGRKVRDANLFHPGFVVAGDLKSGWEHRITGDIQLYRNPNQIPLDSIAAGNAIYSARNFQIAHAGYRLVRKDLWLDFQASRNLGAGRLRDAVMASANLGAVHGFGDMRFLYQFAIKDANALISQFTDDDLGTGSGVNIAVHAVRFDLGLTRFLQWQNLLFIQNQRRASNPAEQFFVPLQRGANPTFRYLGQLAFSF